MEKDGRYQSIEILARQYPLAELDPPIGKFRIENLYPVAADVRERKKPAPGSLVGTLPGMKPRVPYANFLVGHPVLVVQKMLAVIVHRRRGRVGRSSFVAVATGRPSSSISPPTEGRHH